MANENNFNTQTIALHAISNSGKMRFRAAFLNWVVFDYFYRNDTSEVSSDS
jgi:hypothetical protein